MEGKNLGNEEDLKIAGKHGRGRKWRGGKEERKERKEGRIALGSVEDDLSGWQAAGYSGEGKTNK